MSNYVYLNISEQETTMTYLLSGAEMTDALTVQHN